MRNSRPKPTQPQLNHVKLGENMLPLPTTEAAAAMVVGAINAEILKHALRALAAYCDDGTPQGRRTALILRELATHTAIGAQPTPWTAVVEVAVMAAEDRFRREQSEGE